jgi:hypothetical protein
MGASVWRRRLADRKVLAHLLEAFLSDAADREQVIDAFESTVGFAHLQNFFGGRGADPGDLLELFGVRSVDVDGLGRRLFCRAGETLQDKAER